VQRGTMWLILLLSWNKRSKSSRLRLLRLQITYIC